MATTAHRARDRVRRETAGAYLNFNSALRLNRSRSAVPFCAFKNRSDIHKTRPFQKSER